MINGEGIRIYYIQLDAASVSAFTCICRVRQDQSLLDEIDLICYYCNRSISSNRDSLLLTLIT